MSEIREELIDELKLRLGSGMIDVELDPNHYDLAVKMAIRRYRQRSGRGTIEGFAFIEVQTDVATYTLPKEIQEVRAIYRRNLGATGMAGSAIDPFSLSFTNNIYMIQNPGNISTGGAGVLATYDLAVGFQKLAGRLFGRDINFTWDTATKKLTFHRRFTAPEEMGLHVYVVRDDDTLLNDPYSRPWIQDYSLAQCKLMLGEARSLFSSLAGPQGGVTMNGEALKTEAQAEMERLDTELKNNVDASMPFGFTIG